tara:strand:- start:2081 stop:2929 length:849 start_codon:yes stop_codon:yes gene_type:complete
MGLEIVLTMNIKHNRYILFVGPLVWTFVSLSTPRSLEAGIFTLWFVLTNLYDMLEISHNKIFNYTPAKISKMRKYICTETILSCWFSSLGFPKLSILGILLLKIFKNPVSLSAILGLIWGIWWTLGCFIDWNWFIGAYPKWYGILIIFWGIIRHAIKLEIESLSSHNHGLQKYLTIWLFRFVEQFLLSSLRWFTWCDCVFPYQLRYDIWLYGLCITMVFMWVVNYRKPQQMLTFEAPFDEFHMPAPSKETAQLCNICREKQKVIDVETGGGFWGVKQKVSIL